MLLLSTVAAIWKQGLIREILKEIKWIWNNIKKPSSSDWNGIALLDQRKTALILGCNWGRLDYSPLSFTVCSRITYTHSHSYFTPFPFVEEYSSAHYFCLDHIAALVSGVWADVAWGKTLTVLPQMALGPCASAICHEKVTPQRAAGSRRNLQRRPEPDPVRSHCQPTRQWQSYTPKPHLDSPHCSFQRCFIKLKLHETQVLTPSLMWLAFFNGFMFCKNSESQYYEKV